MTEILKKAEERNVYFIAEIGQNHQGSLDIAKKMVDELKQTNISAIKLVKRDIDICLSEEQKNMPYINPNSFGDTYYEHRKALEFSKDDFITLKKYIEDTGLDFISSFTDVNSLDFLVDIGTKILKIPSQRIIDIPLLKQVALKKLPTIISTGMSTCDDIHTALHILEDCEKYLLQCTSLYPADFPDLNLNVINTYKIEYFGLIDGVGFSGHYPGVSADIAAYMLGATIIERHFTLHPYWKGSDHSSSLTIDGIKYILKYIGQISLALGSKEKKILKKEKETIKKLRGDLM